MRISTSRSAYREGSKTDVFQLDHVVFIVLCTSLLLRLSLLLFESKDYTMFLSVWYDRLSETGPWKGIGQPSRLYRSYCYPPLYLSLIALSTTFPIPKLYAIKLISIVGDYVGLLFFLRIVSMKRSVQWFSAAAFLFAPTVVLNSALWGQCDMLYSAAFLACLFYLLKKRHFLAFVAYGVAISFKPQAFFVLPFLVGFAWSQSVSWRFFFVPVFVYFAFAIPSIIAGRPVIDSLFSWIGFAVDTQSPLTRGAATWYAWLPVTTGKALFWCGLVMGVMAALLIVFSIRRLGDAFLTFERLLFYALMSAIICPFFFPGMHERYFFLADVLSLLFALSSHFGWQIAVLFQISSVSRYLPFLFDFDPVPSWLSSMLVVAAVFRLYRLRPPTNNQVLQS